MYTNENKHKLMVVDDEENNLKSVELAFQDKNFHITSLTNPNEALKIIQENTPDILLLDIMMPEMTGIEMAEKINELGYTLPIIFLTSLSDNTTKKHAFSLGIEDYIVKPFLEEELIYKVNKKLDSSLRVKESEQSWAMIKSIIEDILPHEINTPLTSVILGLSEMENQKESFKLEVSKFISFIENNVPELRELNFFIYLKNNLKTFLNFDGKIKSLVDVAVQRLERLVKKIIFYNEKFQFKKEATDIKPLIFELLKEYNKDIDFHIHDLTANFDKKLIKEAIKVLVDNCFIHNQNNVNVKVSVKHQSNFLTITVEDDGVGIKKQNLPYIFKPYYIAHNVLNHTEGVGLGLYFVKKVVDAHNGKIQVQSIPNEKTFFVIKLPL